MALPTFSKHATLNNLSYLPLDHTDGISEYTAGTISGQRLTFYRPSGSPGDYWVNRFHPTRWATIVYYHLTGYTSSLSTYSNATSLDITNAAATWDTGVGGFVGGGFLWQCLMNGVQVVSVQVTAAATTNPGGGTVPNGKGFFHAPGGVNYYYETKNRPSAKSDAVMAWQYLKYRADDAAYAIAKNAMAVCGTSAGADTASWLGLAPDRAWELGSWGPYRESTVPNCNMIFLLTHMWWDHMTADAGAGQFPGAETGGVGVDDIASAGPTPLGSAPTRYKVAASAISYISELGKPCIPPTYYWTVSAAQNAAIGEPFLAGIGGGSQQGTAGHTLWPGLMLRNVMPPGKVFLSCSAADNVLTTQGASVAAYVDATDMPNGAGLLNGCDVDANAGIGTLPASDIGGDDRPINFLLQHINDRTWDDGQPESGIVRRGHVNLTGRYCVPPNSKRRGIELSGHNSNIPTGASAVALFYGPNSQQANNQFIATTPTQGGTRFIPGTGPLWIKAGSIGATNMAGYEAREVF